MSRSNRRARNNFSTEVFENLCRVQCTAEEIARVFGITAEALDQICADRYGGRTFAEVFEEKRAGGLISLRCAMFNAADNGDPAVLTWLGDEYLSRRDHNVRQTTTALEMDLAHLFQLAGLPSEESIPQGVEIIRRIRTAAPAAHQLLTNCIYESSPHTFQQWVLADLGVSRDRVDEFSEWLTREGGLLAAPLATERVS